MPPLRIGMLGLGTVGAGTWRVLTRNQRDIVARSGRPMEIVAVAVRDLERARRIVGGAVALTTDPFDLVNRADIDVVVEVMGGTTLARELVLQAIANGKHVVTANKALLAEHGAEIFAAAEARGVIVAYEAAVAVSIPIIKALREGLVANRIAWVAGIVNGTSNFILTEMGSKGIGYANALKDAQDQGFAEADPRFDVEGTDAAHKLCLLAANAFGTQVPFAEVHTEGITELEAVDLACAEALGYRIKLLGVARRHDHSVEVRVHPALLRSDHLLAGVDGSMNAVMVHGDASGTTLYYGAGAGSEQTASAVIADLVDVARSAACDPSERVPHRAFQSHAMADLPLRPMADTTSAWYLRIICSATPTAERALLRTLARFGLQARIYGRYAQPDHSAHHVVLTQPVAYAALRRALVSLEQLPAVQGKVRAVRVETLE
ncbi:homoserine dehydrogenase [Rhodoferax lacus]|uniref:Homoserine dehydrogenase n=1 Tax=Rhodoferax lacus TaxID=2184758 RepID=A0A3E1R6U7_9BURK|nr:homoserine dehydrogenase [Rhodoferax lacus]